MTEEEKIKVADLKQQGLKYKEISKEVGVSISAAAYYISRYRRDLLTVRKFSVEEIDTLLALRDEGLTYSVIAEKLEVPIYKVKEEIRKLRLSRSIPSIRGARGGNMSINSKTRLYLVKFDTFYKVGVTQQSVKDRFKGGPKHIVIDHLETSLEEAWELERLVKEQVKDIKYEPSDPWFERNGKTECFIPPHPINALEEIFDL